MIFFNLLIKGEYMKLIYGNPALQPRVELTQIEQSMLESVRERSEKR